MLRGSDFFLAVMAAMAALTAYHAFFPLDAMTIMGRFTGLAGFMLLCISLMLGPLAILFPKTFAALLEYRKSVGLASFLLVFIHFFLVYVGYYGLDLGRTLAGPLLFIAAPALALYILLALTSNSWSMKNVPQWKNVQRLAYIVFILSFIHFIIKANGLFTTVAGKAFVNMGEMAMLALGAATIVLQIAGAATVFRRKKQG